MPASNLTDNELFDVIGRFWRKNASMIVSVRDVGVPCAAAVGVITKEHIADSVAESVRPYANPSAAAGFVFQPHPTWRGPIGTRAAESRRGHQSGTFWPRPHRHAAIN